MISAPQSKNAVCASTKHSRYFFQSTFMLKSCMCIMFDMVDTVLNIDCLLISLGNFQFKRKYSAFDLKCTYCIFTVWVFQ